MRKTGFQVSAGDAVSAGDVLATSDEARSNYKLSALEEDILTVLSIRPSYGLEISKAIEKASQSTRLIGVGSLYPSLRRLEEKKLVKSYWESGDDRDDGGARRRYYRIEEKGLAILQQNQTIRENLLQWQPA